VHCPAPVLIATTLLPLHMPQDVDSPPLPDSLTFFYNHLGPLLLSPSRNTQVSTAHLLAAVANDLVASEGEGKDEEEERSLPLRLMEVVLRGGAALEGVLQEWKVGEPAPTIPPGCAAHTAAMVAQLESHSHLDRCSGTRAAPKVFRVPPHSWPPRPAA